MKLLKVIENQNIRLIAIIPNLNPDEMMDALTIVEKIYSVKKLLTSIRFLLPFFETRINNWISSIEEAVTTFEIIALLNNQEKAAA